jgi:DNA-binding LacI/PurR family transcriptional regulator
MNTRVTMEEVAAKAGVSTSTVCRALSNSPQISEKTRGRVRQIAEEMGYRPDPLLSAFATRNRTKAAGSDITTIAYITNFPTAQEWRTNPFYASVYQGAERRADALGYKLEHFWLRDPGMTGARLSRVLYNRGISAICVAPTPWVRGHLSLDWERFSCVTLGYSMMRPDLHRTTPHHYHAVLAAVREVRRLGYRRVGLCMFAGTSRRVDDQWVAGWLVGQKQFKDMHLPYFLFEDETRPEIADWAKAQDLEMIIGGELAVLAELRRAGIYPGMLHYASLSWTAAEQGVAGIDQRPEAIGMAAIDVVIGQLQRGERGVPEFAMTAMVEGRWIGGESAPGREKLER